MSSSVKQEVPLVFIGYKRTVGVKFMPPIFEKTRYKMTGFLEFLETKEPYLYTPHNLATVLHNLYPRPRALVIGMAIDKSYMAEMESVWNEYVHDVLKEESNDADWKENAFVPLPLTHYVDPTVGKPQPPMNTGWDTEMFRQLDAVFEPGKDKDDSG